MRIENDIFNDSMQTGDDSFSLIQFIANSRGIESDVSGKMEKKRNQNYIISVDCWKENRKITVKLRFILYKDVCIMYIYFYLYRSRYGFGTMEIFNECLGTYSTERQMLSVALIEREKEHFTCFFSIENLLNERKYGNVFSKHLHVWISRRLSNTWVQWISNENARVCLFLMEHYFTQGSAYFYAFYSGCTEVLLKYSKIIYIFKWFKLTR